MSMKKEMNVTKAETYVKPTIEVIDMEMDGSVLLAGADSEIPNGGLSNLNGTGINDFLGDSSSNYSKNA